MVFGNGVKNIQATAYNGARTVGKGFLAFFKPPTPVKIKYRKAYT